MPSECKPEEIDRWMRGELVLTDEGLFNYWQQEWVICTDRIHHLETTLAGMTAPSRDDPEKPSAHPKTIAAYQERLETARARARVIQERGVQLDPEGRVFNAADYEATAALPLAAARLDPVLRHRHGEAVAVPDLRPERPRIPRDGIAQAHPLRVHQHRRGQRRLAGSAQAAQAEREVRKQSTHRRNLRG